MDPMTVSVAAGMRARMESLDLLANNIANASTAGYKADRDAFLPWLSSEAAGSPLTPTDSPDLARHWTDFSQGVLNRSGESLDFAIQGRGFFQVETAAGPRFTRNGSFVINRDGKLQTQEGHLVRVRPPEGRNTYRLDPNLPVQADAKGELRQSGVLVGTIEVVDFESLDALQKQGAGYFKMDASTFAPKAATGFDVKQGYLENANGGVAESSVRLVNIMRQFEALQKAAGIGAEMNRRSVEEVAKVNG
jgi:flagellar basal-body rod protein FlgF